MGESEMTPSNLALPGLLQTCDVRFGESLALFAVPGRRVLGLKVGDGYYRCNFVEEKSCAQADEDSESVCSDEPVLETPTQNADCEKRT